jgi:outer membrane protein OmpA-like peptidoglycan-associated protein
LTWKMNDFSRHEGVSQQEPNRQVEVDTDYQRLRKLLLAPEHAELEDLQHRTSDTRQRIENISQVLPDAIVHRSKRDNHLSTALAPTVVSVVNDAVRRNPKAIADALFPVIGPAIRKAIAEAFRNLTESMTRAMDSNFSLQSLKWRIEAKRSNRTFAEVLLAHSLVYRVEQVFLIHRDTGLLLQHLVAESAIVQDADMVSGMLTAIQDFVKDSFDSDSEEGLNTIHVGDLTIILEQGPMAVLAGVVRGTPKRELREVFQLTLEEVHLQVGEALEAFDGDTDPFEATRPYLEPCLRSQVRKEERKVSPVFWVAPLLILMLLGIWSHHQFKKHNAWNDYLDRLDAEPGIVVTTSDTARGRYTISGLRDPLAADPESLLEDARLDAEDVVARWEPYQALDETFVLKRAGRILQPPDTVQLHFESATLNASGKATAQWVNQSRLLARSIAGVAHYRTDSVTIVDNDSAILEAAYDILDPPDSVDMTVQGGLLTVTGSAPHGWIQFARDKWETIGGVQQYLDDHLTDSDRHEFNLVADQLESMSVFFTADLSLAPGEQLKLHDWADKIIHLQSLAALRNKQLIVDIIGHTDSLGSDTDNLALGQERADYIREFLIKTGVSPNTLVAVGVGENQTFAPAINEQNHLKNRRVTLKVKRETS